MNSMFHTVAYIDPSVMTYAIQAVAGVVIAGGAVFFVWWRKVKRKVTKTLGIDENAHKEVEGDIEINDDCKNNEPVNDSKSEIDNKSQNDNKSEN